MPVIGKRKRQDEVNNNNDVDDVDSNSSQRSFRLTEANLATLQTAMRTPVSESPSKKTRSNPSDTVVSNATSATTQARAGINEILETWNIFVDHPTAVVPPGLQQLLTTIRKPRNGPVTPLSLKVVRLQQYTKDMGELDAIKTLEGYLALRTEIDDGEPGVYRASDQQWKQSAIPKPKSNLQDDENLQAAMKVVGSPPKPKPDLSFGYTKQTFAANEMMVIRSILPLQVTDDPPYFPYLVYEWKSEKNAGTMYDAVRQAMRDGAAAVHSMCRVFERKINVQASAESTAIFSVCVSSYLEMRVHWRNMTATETSWESKVIQKCFLDDPEGIFLARSIVRNILEWAKETRLNTIRASLIPKLKTKTISRDLLIQQPMESKRGSRPPTPELCVQHFPEVPFQQQESFQTTPSRPSMSLLPSELQQHPSPPRTIPSPSDTNSPPPKRPRITSTNTKAVGVISRN